MAFTPHKFEDFFDINTKIKKYELIPPRSELVEKIAEDFEVFVNHTRMGKRFVLQLIEVRDGNDEKPGIGKISFTEHSNNTSGLLKGKSNDDQDVYAQSIINLTTGFIFNKKNTILYHFLLP